MITLYALTIVALSALSLWRVRPRVAALFAAGAVAVSLLTIELMGVPKPAWTETRSLNNSTVIAVVVDPDQAIYVWVKGNPPVAYSMPWSEELAKQLQDSMRQARAMGLEGVEMKRGKGGEYIAGVPGIAPMIIEDPKDESPESAQAPAP